MQKFLPVLMLVAFCSCASAKNWLVGATRTYTKPSAVASLVGNGDTVSIDAGTYTSDVGKWTANNLLLRGVGGYAYLQSNGANYGGKAIWVIDGTNTKVEWIEFSGCVVADNNGAGIRQEAANLTVRHCYFHDNQEGILAGTVANSKIVIEFTEFSHNGAGDGYSHNLYINNIDTLIFRFNYSHLAVVGHELKSRAKVNYILYNRISNEDTGTASRNIDLPNGGQAIIIGNIIQQGPNTQNGNMIEFGLEGLVNPGPQELYLINNTIVNNRQNGGIFVDLKSGMDFYKAMNNIFAGKGTLLSGSATTIDTSYNWITTDTGAVNFFNTSHYDYHLLSNSPAINVGANAGSSHGGFSLAALFEYNEATDSVARIISSAIDLGAYEFASPLDFNKQENNSSALSFYEFDRMLHITSENAGIFYLFDVCGRLITAKNVTAGNNTLSLDQLPAGIYFIECYSVKNYYSGKIVLP